MASRFSRARRLAAKPVPVPQALKDFLKTEVAGGVVLCAAVVVALVWSNVLFRETYEQIWSLLLTIDLNGVYVRMDLRHWINEGAMTIFFLVVGLEIKRELVSGELRDWRVASLPAMAALGGMIVPAAIYLAFNRGSGGTDGWGVPMATDIALALGVLSLLGDRVPAGLRLFVLSLAIVDDIGAVLVIAIAYSEGISIFWLEIAGATIGLVAASRIIGVRWRPWYVSLGTFLWLALHEADVHATMTGVIMGLLTPVMLREGEAHSEAEKVEELLHPWSSYLVVPLFALANAGVRFRPEVFDGAESGRVFLGILFGLVAGKLVGIVAFTWLGRRLFGARLPEGMTAKHVVGAGLVAGIGFTVALLVAQLAFSEGSPDGRYLDVASLAVLVASLLSAAAGFAVLARGKNQESDAKTTA